MAEAPGILSRLAQHAAERPEAIAACEAAGGRRLGWRALRDAAASFDERLGPDAEAGAWLVVAPNRLELLVALIAGLARGAAVAPLSPDLPARQLCAIAARARARIAIGDDAALAALAGVPALRRVPLSEVLAAPAHAAPPLAASVRGALLLATSGTTGVPKLVRRTAPALDAVGVGTAACVGVRADDRMLLAIPLHHSYGIDQGVLTAIAAGCTVELHEEFSLPRVRASLQRGATLLPAVPYMLDVLARSQPNGAARSAGLRVLSAGGALPRAVFDAFHARFGVRAGQLYGATEFGSVTYGDPASEDFAPESAGRPFDGVAIRIVDVDRSGLAPLPTGAEGQVAVASPSLLAEYAGDDAAPLRDGFFLTGDLGRLDARGRLWITGRLALLVDVGGRKVNPLEVEAVLESHPGVLEAAVVPIPYSRTVERLKAIVVPAVDTELRPDALRRFLQERLAPHQVPRRFELRDALPRSKSGKLLRRTLLDGAREGGAP